MNDKSLTEYLSLPTGNHSIKLNILEGFDHKRVAKDSAVGDWGPIMKAGCGFQLFKVVWPSQHKPTDFRSRNFSEVVFPNDGKQHVVAIVNGACERSL